MKSFYSKNKFAIVGTVFPILFFISIYLIGLIAPILSYYMGMFHGVFYSLLILRLLNITVNPEIGFYKKLNVIAVSQLIYFSALYIYMKDDLSIFSILISGSLGAILFILLFRTLLSFKRTSYYIFLGIVFNGIVAMIPSYLSYLIDRDQSKIVIYGTLSIIIWQCAMSIILNKITKSVIILQDSVAEPDSSNILSD